MSFDILGLFKRQNFTERPPERQTLVIPVHERVDKSESQSVLEAAAAQIAGSALLWRWIRHDGSARLCRWDTSEKAFLQGNLDDWARFFG